MRVLVTGASGFVGGHLLRRLAPAHEVFALARATPRGGPSGVRWVEQDLTRPLDRARLPGAVDAVIHLAQSRLYKQFPESAGDIYEVNVGATFRLLDYAAAAGARRFVFTSSGGVYGLGSGRPFVETDPPDPPDFYLGTKCAAELLVRGYASALAPFIFRLFFPYGAGQPAGMLIPRLAGFVLRGEPILLQGEGGLRINPVYVGDVAEALARSLEFEGGGTFNLGGGEALSLREVGEAIGRALGREPVFAVEAGAHARSLLGDVTGLRTLLGVEPRRFSEGVAEVCREAARAHAGVR